MLSASLALADDFKTVSGKELLNFLLQFRKIVSAIDNDGRTVWVVEAHRDDRKRYRVSADEKLTAFLELERAIHEFAVSLVLSA